jgi:hypothetical protein
MQWHHLLANSDVISFSFPDMPDEIVKGELVHT